MLDDPDLLSGKDQGLDKVSDICIDLSRAQIQIIMVN